MTNARVGLARNSNIATVGLRDLLGERVPNLIKGWLCAILVVVVVPAWAQDVTLTSRDGGVQVSGQLLAFDGEFYRIATDFGDLTLDGSGVQCEGPGCPEMSAFVANISFSGPARIAQDLMPELLAAFARSERYELAQSAGPDDIDYELSDNGRVVARISVRHATNETAIASLIGGQSDVALSTREVLPSEVSLGLEAGIGDLSRPLQNRVAALDAVVPITSARNPVGQISLTELGRAFSGDIAAWSELGGADALIFLHLLKGDTITRRILQERILLPTQSQLATRITYHDDAAALARSVATDPFALGLTTLSQKGAAKALELHGGCGFRVTADAAALKAEDYPLTAPIFLYLKDTRLPKIGREFMRFLRTPTAQVAILRAGHVDQGFGRIALDRQGRRLANAIRNAGDEIGLSDLQDLVSEMDEKARLSVTFRFREGTAELDGQSRSNVLLMARALETGSLRADEISFVGFSDGDGDAGQNRRLSVERARAVRAAVLDAAVTFSPGQMRINARGMGEALPMACDDTVWGRQINRRVEVWVR